MNVVRETRVVVTAVLIVMRLYLPGCCSGRITCLSPAVSAIDVATARCLKFHADGLNGMSKVCRFEHWLIWRHKYRTRQVSRLALYLSQCDSAAGDLRLVHNKFKAAERWTLQQLSVVLQNMNSFCTL